MGLEYDKTNYGAFLDIDPLTEKLSLRTLVSFTIELIIHISEREIK